MKKKWTVETIIEDASKFESSFKWRKASQGAYLAASRAGILDKISFRTKTPKGALFWTKDKVIADAKKFCSKNEWRTKSAGAYDAAKSRGFFEEATAHMEKSRNDSVAEKEIFRFVADLFPCATRKRFGKKINGKYGTMFEMDTYIPSLNIGIEFNGSYWHSMKGLTRGRSKWPIHMITNYHNIKRDFFKALGIVYLEIDEKDWIGNKKACLSKVQCFLMTHLRASCP